jgi:hypothetical protein
MADEATQDCTKRVRVVIACESAMTTQPQWRYGDVTAR